MNQLARAAFVSAFAAAPLALAPGLLLGFDITPKIALVLLAASVLIVCPDPWLPGLRSAWRDRGGRCFLAALGLHAAALAAATALSTNVGVSFAGSRWRQLGLPVELALTALAAAALGWLWGRPERRRVLLDAVAVAAIPISVYAILQYFGVDPVLPRALYYAGREEWAVVRPPSTFGHAGYFATWAVPAFFLVWPRAEEGAGARKAWRIAAAALLFVAIVLSGTRGALVGLFAGMLVAGPHWRSMRGRRAVTTLAVIAVATLAFLLSPGGTRLRTRVLWAAEDYQGGARPWLWRDSLALGLARPFAGHGLETFTAEFSKVRSEDLAVRFPDQTEESPHNIFLDAWATQGLLGTVALLGLCAAPLMSSRRRSSAAAAFVASLIANQFLAFTAMTEAIFLLCAALAVAPGTGSHEDSPAPNPLLRLAGAAFALGLAAFTFTLLQAEAAAEGARQQLFAGRFSDATELYRRAQAAAPPGRSYADWFAGALSGNEGFSTEWADVALAALDPARSESPADAYYVQAGLAAQAGRPAAEVETALRASIDAAPSWYKPRWKLAQVLQSLSRPDEALEWAESADRLSGDRHPEVRATLDAVRAATASRGSSR